MFAAALVLTAPGIPMIFQGQEFLEDGYLDDDDPLDWTKITTYAGIVQLYKDLIGLRLNHDGNSSGLAGSSINVHHVNDVGKLLEYHRWGTGGEGDDVIVVMNFSIDEKSDYRIGLPNDGAWYLVFNSDSTEYAGDYSDIGQNTYGTSYTYDGLAYSGLIDIPPYSVLIYSQVDSAGEPCIGDLNEDGIVDVSDLLAIIGAWGTPDADITGDNMTDVSDLLVAIGAYGQCP